jgi:sarcosine oxidase subunit beta
MHVAVVGGGIVGLASAYYLADRGAEVTVCEKSSVGAGSTDRANGGIRAQFTSGVSVALSRASIEVWDSFDEEFGVDVQYRRPGYLFLAREESTAAQFRENVRVQREHGVDSEFVSPAEAKELCPGLRADEYVGGTYSPTDGFADPHLGLQGFSQAAASAGAEVRTGVEVTDVRLEDGQVVGVETDAGEIEADYVVNAAGPWAARVGRMAGLELPVSPRRRQLMVVDPETPVPSDVPMTVDMDDGAHFRPERDGSAVVGGMFTDEDPEQDPDDYRTTTGLDWAAETLGHAAGVADYFGPDSEVVRGWAGLYAVTPDHHPIVEETIPGLVNAVGFSGHGFMQSPATGQVVSELVLDGEPSTVDVSALTADRFERGETLTEGTVID